MKRQTSQRGFTKALNFCNLAFLILLALFVPVGMSAQAAKEPPPAEFKIPPDAAAKQNPIKPSAESHARGKKLYGYDCAMCHGKDGDGKGDMAADYKFVTDFTDRNSLKSRSDGELFYIIRNGKGQDMPPEGERAKDDDIWHLVNYIRSLGKK